MTLEQVLALDGYVQAGPLYEARSSYQGSSSLAMFGAVTPLDLKWTAQETQAMKTTGKPLRAVMDAEWAGMHAAKAAKAKRRKAEAYAAYQREWRARQKREAA